MGTKLLEYSTTCTDILIIGSGAAGLRTAIAAHDSGVKDVVVIGKCKRGDAHTVLATGGINAALGTMDPKDSYLVHAADTAKEGWFIADPKAVLALCRNGPNAVNELVRWGARFHREKDGRLTQRFFGAHTYRRTCFFGDQTGKEMMRVLIRQVRKRKIRFLGDVFVVSLLTCKGAISGALAIDFGRGRVVLFRSKSVVLAAGGYTKIYSRSSSRGFENHGDGAALAFEIGVPLVDMEMVQFHPTGMIYPKSMVGSLVTEAVRGEGGILLNSKLERFMKRYDPVNMELGPRDFVARSIYTEIMEGRATKHGGVWLDITMLPKSRILDRLPKMYEKFKKYDNVDISRERMEVAPTAHYTMGGVDVDLKGRTRIKGLYAAGETVGQIHGANRLGGNSLLETVVFGKIVGEDAARFVKTHRLAQVDHIELERRLGQLGSIFGKSKVDGERIRQGIQSAMWTYAGIARDGARLSAGLREIGALRRRFDRVRVGRAALKENLELKTTIETRRMFALCEAVMKSAIARRESRGAHYRTDYPKTKESLRLNILSHRTAGGGVGLSTRKVPKVSGPLKREIEKLEETPVRRSFE
ncbi:MAG: FAD-binding protein [Candidatus Micrarchaeota archaeon]|nr:FAD-binding protein [Candidatus Micrarchaeota archaeon]